MTLSHSVPCRKMTLNLCPSLVTSLTSFLQSVCQADVRSDSLVQLTGHLYLTVDTGQSSGQCIEFVVDEKCWTSNDGLGSFISKTTQMTNQKSAESFKTFLPPNQNSVSKDDVRNTGKTAEIVDDSEMDCEDNTNNLNDMVDSLKASEFTSELTSAEVTTESTSQGNVSQAQPTQPASDSQSKSLDEKEKLLTATETPENFSMDGDQTITTG